MKTQGESTLLADLTLSYLGRTTTLKGDAPGHPFRGNQYGEGQGGESGDGDSSGGGDARSRYSSDDRPDARQYNTHEELIGGLQEGRRDAEIAAETFNNQVESGVRSLSKSGRLPRSAVTKINKIIREQASGSEALSSDLTSQTIERVKRNQRILDIVKANIKP